MNELMTETKLLTRKEAAAYIGIAEHTLDVWRYAGKHNIPYIKVGRLVKYRKDALDEFLNRQTFGSIKDE